MKKNLLSSFGKKLIVSSLIASSFVAGGLVAGYYLFFDNKEEEPKKIEYIFSDARPIYGNNSPIFYQATPKNKKEYWLNDDEVEMLLDKIRNELGYGPEFGKLRSITIGDENMTGEDANGIYLPTLNKIYINLENFKKVINDLKFKTVRNIFYDSKILSQIKVNLIFETIFHEYGHHIAFSYLTNEFDNSLERDKSIFVNTYENNKLTRVPSHWNKNFTKEFKKLLNYSNWEGEKYDSTTQIYSPNSDNPLEYKSIGSIYSQQDLFNHANGDKEYDYPEMDRKDKIPYMFAGKSKFVEIIPWEVPKENLSYYYSMDELFTRKYQQLNQIYDPFLKISPFLEGYFGYSLANNNFKISTISDILSNTLLYQNGFGVVKQNNIELEDYYTNKSDYYNFKDSTVSNRFLYDAPFNNHEYTYKKKENGILKDYKLQDNHINLYNLMDNFLGHSTGADISIVWPKNEIKVLNNDSKKFTWNNIDIQNANNKFKFGGYVKTDDYISVGYKNNQNSEYKELSKITVKKFTYKHKNSLSATQHENLDTNKENWFYTTNKFIDKNKLLNKELWFKKLDGNLEQLLTVRGYRKEKVIKSNKKSNKTNIINTGTNSTWYSNFSDILKINQKYSFVLDNGSVKFKEIP